MTRRPLALLALLPALFFSHAAAQTTIRLVAQSTGQGNPPMEALIDAFEKANPTIKVRAEYFPIGTGYSQLLRTQLQSNSAPDLFYVTSGSGGLVSVLPLAEAGYVADLSKRPWGKTVISKNARHLFFSGTELAAVPLGVTPVVAVYNTTAMAQAGITPPRTMKELLAACKTARSKGKSMIALAGANAQNAGLLASTIAQSMVLASDPNWNDKRTKNQVTFANSAGWKRTLQTVVDMKNAGCFIPGAEGADLPQAAPMLANGSALMFVIPTGAISALKGINPSISLGAIPLPGLTHASTTIAVTPSDALAVSKTSKNLDAALRFADFVATGGGSEVYAKATGNISAQQASTGRNLPDELSGISSILSGKSRVRPLIQLEWKNPQVYNTLGTGVQGLLTGQLTVDALLARLDAAWNR